MWFWQQSRDADAHGVLSFSSDEEEEANGEVDFSVAVISEHVGVAGSVGSFA